MTYLKISFHQVLSSQSCFAATLGFFRFSSCCTLRGERQWAESPAPHLMQLSSAVCFDTGEMSAKCWVIGPCLSPLLQHFTPLMRVAHPSCFLTVATFLFACQYRCEFVNRLLPCVGFRLSDFWFVAVCLPPFVLFGCKLNSRQLFVTSFLVIYISLMHACSFCLNYSAFSGKFKDAFVARRNKMCFL